MKKTLISLSSVFAFFLLWVLGSALLDDQFLMPGPLAVFRALGSILTDSQSLIAIGSTLLRLLLAMGIAFFLGVLLGVVAGLKPHFGDFLRPIVTILRTVPVLSIIVIALLLLGFRKTPYFITFLMIFPLIYQAVSEGIKNIDSELIDVYSLEDNHFFTGLTHCYLPLIQDQIKTSLLQSAGLGIKVLVMAEYLAQTQSSIGNMLYLKKVNLEFDQVFAWTMILVLLAVVLEAFIEKYAKRRGQNEVGFPRKQEKLD
jgi:NitT/TauT family transport system permease protein